MMKKGTYTQICWAILAALLMLTGGCGGGDSGDSSSSGGDGTVIPPGVETFTIRGTITAPNNVAIDSDVNDISVTPVSNDYFDGDQAQVLPNPVILGGFVNRALSGDVEGNSYLFGDQSDVFQITLTENQTVTLYIADYTIADLDLYLYGENPDPNTPLVSSTGESFTESLQAPSAGTYYIEVYAYSGASNYVLTTGQTATRATVMDERLADDFIPGEIIVRFKENAEETFDRSLRSNDAAILGLRHKAGVPQRKMLLGLSQENRERVFRSLNMVPTEQNRQLFQTADPENQLKLDTLRTIEALKKRSDVIYAEPNYIRKIFAVPNDEYYPKQWHYPLINLPEAWEITGGGSSDVIVAVVDTGILTNHPDINSPQLVDGYDFIRSTDISVDGDGIDGNPDDPGDDMQGGSSFHGTHVAGTIAAATNNGTGVSGVAWNCKIMPLRALGKGGGSSYDIMQAIRYAAGLPNDSGLTPAQPADIINLSLGGGSYSQSEQDDFNDVRAQGVIIIAAAGNENTSAPSYPAAYDGVISVSAVGADKSLAPYSNYGATIDIAAPGGDLSQDIDNNGYPDGVLSTVGDDSSGGIQMTYKHLQGTSMAAPHMAGVAALMKSVNSDLTPEILDNLIQSGDITFDLTGDGATVRNNSYGYGLINAQNAVIEAQKLEGSATIAAMLAVNPTTLNFENSRTAATLTADNLGEESLEEVSPSENADWLEITSNSVDADGLGTYTVAVDDTGLADGPYTAVITFDSSKNSVKVFVSMLVGNVSVSGNAGYHYILLINPETYENVAQFDIPTPTSGTYSYSLQAPAGNYILFAGTDSDNDYYIGDSGESSGAYISMDQPVEILLDQNLTGYDFTTTFNIYLPTTSSTDNDESVFPIMRNGKYKITK